MSIQFLGMIGHRLSSETIAPAGPVFDRDYIVRFAQTHEAAGFDRLLVGHWIRQPWLSGLPRWPGYRRRKSIFCWPIARDSSRRRWRHVSLLPWSICSAGVWRCISSAAATMPNSVGMVTTSTMTSATRVPMLSWIRCEKSGLRNSPLISTMTFIRRAGVVGNPPAATTAHSDLLRRLVRGRHCGSR